VRSEDPGTIIMQGVVDSRYVPGDEERPNKMARAMRDEVNRAFMAGGLPEVEGRALDARIARYIETKAGKAEEPAPKRSKSSRSLRA
jgi:hypothetical protein